MVGRTPHSQLDKTCSHCGNPLVRKRYNGRLESNNNFQRRKYCDQACMSLGLRKESPTRSAYQKRAKTYRKDACEMCGSADNLSVHHRNRDWRDNDPTNLETLCSSCHTSLHHEHGEIVPKATLRPCRYCGRMSGLSTCETCKTRIRKHGDPFVGKKWRQSSKTYQ